ncbi:hypothetical protein TSOC_008267, partial [Tetrabaena socialis]
LWLACALLADALAVTAQSLMARDLGAGSAVGARQVAARVNGLGLGLGLLLAAGLAAAGLLAGLPRLFATKLNAPATYAKCAKYQRLANAKDKDLAELAGGTAVPSVAQRLLLLCGTVKTLLLGLLTLTMWEGAVAQLAPRAVAAPFNRLLAFPRGAELAPFGGVTIGPWLLLADTATGAVASLRGEGRGVDLQALEREAAAAGRRPGAAAGAAGASPNRTPP